MQTSLKATIALLLTLALASLPSQAQEMNIIETFERHVENEQWDEALPLIAQIVQRGPDIPTSWRNYGVVLDELGRHSEAAKAFGRAYELNPEDYGTQYRVFRSLSLADDASGFIEFAEHEATSNPEIIESISDAEEFSAITESSAFQDLARKHSR